MPGSEAEKRIERLYTLPLEEFTSARDVLARELRKTGERDEAGRVKKLRKPTVAAWLVNQLARREKMNVRALFSAAERLREAHHDVLQGKSTAKLEKARTDERRAIEALARSAAEILRQQRGRTSESVLDDVRDTLHAAAVDADLAEQVRTGRLTREAQASGFGFEVAPAPPRVTQGRSKARSETNREDDRRRRAAQKQLEKARARVREARERLRASEAEAERTRTESERAELRVQADKAALERAEQALSKTKN